MANTNITDNRVANRIILQGDDYRHEEYIAAVPLYPGELLVRNSTNQVSPHATAGGIAEHLVALEDALQGRVIETQYVAGDIVACGYFKSGDKLQMRLDAGANVIIGDHLTSAGNGKLEKVSGSNVAIAISEATIDNTNSEAVPVWIPVRII